MVDLGEITDGLLRDFADGFSVARALPKGIVITRDAQLAAHLCAVGEAPKGYRLETTSLGEEWTDTLEFSLGRLWALLGRQHSEELHRQAFRLEEHWDRHLDAIKMRASGDTLVRYAEMVILHRALKRAGHELGGLLIDVLRAGGLPCGCEGAWPDAPLVVYWPHEEKPVFTGPTPP